MTPVEAVNEIELFKVKRLIKDLESARGNGTSMISIYIPPGHGQLIRVNKMLTEEYGKSSNIKSRVNRQSVASAITSIQQRLKRYNNRCPHNGLVLFCGTVQTEDERKERKISIDFEPFRPVHQSAYLCNNRFHTEVLQEMISENEGDKFGFIVLDGNGCLFGRLQGSNKEILLRYHVDLPKKHSKGGQSALRFARIRLEKRHNYIVKVAELATQIFVDRSANLPNVQGLILAGSADLKNQLLRANSLDARLSRIVLNILDLSYGGEQGFHQAIELSAGTLSNVRLVKEKHVLKKFLNEIARDSGCYCFGPVDTMYALESGAVEDLILYDDLEVSRYVQRNLLTGKESVGYSSTDEEVEQDGQELVGKDSLLEWLSDNHDQFGCNISFVSDRSSEGTQFVRGFGGIGAVLRWKLELGEGIGNLSHGSDDDSSSTCSLAERESLGSGYDFDEGDFSF